MALATGFSLFDTSLGACGIAWAATGIVRVQLPEMTPDATRARLVRGQPSAVEGAPPATARAAIDAMVALLEGDRRDLRFIALDMDGLPPFYRRVYEVSREIGPGETRTYGEVARTLGDSGAARAVGQALGKNPFAIVVPCHRVLAAGDKPGGFSATGGAQTKLRMLAIEGAKAVGSLPLFEDVLVGGETPATRAPNR